MTIIKTQFSIIFAILISNACADEQKTQNFSRTLFTDAINDSISVMQLAKKSKKKSETPIPINEAFITCFRDADNERLFIQLESKINALFTTEEQKLINQFLKSSVSQKITAFHAKASAIKLNDLNAPVDMDTFIKSLTNKEKQQYRDFSASETGRKYTDFSTNFEQKNALVLPIIEEKYNICTQ